MEVEFSGWIFASTRCNFMPAKVWRSTSRIASVM